MKKNQLTRVKDTKNTTIYKVIPLTSYRTELLTIIEAHYSYGAHVNHWGRLFTTNAIRPELNVDYSGVLAEMFGTPHLQKAILKILKNNTPSYKTLYTSSESAINEIEQY